MAELLTYYVVVSLLFLGAPAIFFLIVFMPAVQNTKGRMVGYKDHKIYGDSSIYENTSGDTQGYTLQIGGTNPWHLAKFILFKGEKKMGFNEQNERLNGWAAMIGIIAAMGAYATTGQIIPGIWWWDF